VVPHLGRCAVIGRKRVAVNAQRDVLWSETPSSPTFTIISFTRAPMRSGE